MGMRSLRGLVIVAGLLLVTVGLACADKGTMRDQLIAALDRPAGGFRALLRSPLAAAESAVGDHYEEALAMIPELVKSHPSPRVRLGALRLWPRLVEKQMENRASRLPSADDQTPIRSAAYERASDGDADVRVGALILVAGMGGPAFDREVRSRFIHVRGDLEARKGWRGADKALAVLGGSSDVVKRLQAAAAAGKAPSSFEEDLKQLRREPSAEAVAPLASLFPKLPAIAKRAAPTAYTVVGSGTIYDADTRHARDLVLAWAECAPAGDAASSLRFLRLATPEMMHVLLIELPRVPTGLAATIAIAGSGDFPRSVREEAIERIAIMAGDRSDFERTARDGLVALGKNPEVGELARAALANARRTNPGFSR